MNKTIITTGPSQSVRLLRVFAACLFFVVGGNSVVAQPQPRMGISPDRYEISFDERGGQTQSLMVQNLGDEPVTVKLSVNHWDLDENGQIRIIEPTERSLDQWIVINPLSFTIPPKTPQTVRWAVMPRLKPEDGEYRAIIFIEEDLPPISANEGTQIRMKMRYGLPVYAHIGEGIRSAELNGIHVDRDNNTIFLDITNTGNTHGRMSGIYGVWPVAKFPGTEEALKQVRRAADPDTQPKDFLVGSMPGAVILPGNRRSLPLNIVLGSPGDYVVQLNAEFSGLEITDTIEITEPDS